MGVMLDVNFRVGLRGSTTVGWPVGSAYTSIIAAAAEYAAAGFSAIRMPPSTKGSAGQYSAGYDLFDNYDIGSKPQPYGIVRTAFGTAPELCRAVATLHAHGLQVYGDLVLHQYLGGTADGVYAPLGADGKTKNGRFPKTDTCFVGAPPRVAVDPVPDSTGNFAFGDMAAYVASLPGGYMHAGAIASAGWLARTVGFDGLRIDDAKGTNASLVYDLLGSSPISPLYTFAEYFDGDPSAVSNYIYGYEKGRISALDFAFKFNVQNICNNNSKVWMGQLATIGYCIQDAAHAVTFIDSADTDTSPFQQTIWNKILGYAIMLTFPGYPTVYYRDWSTDEGCYGLKKAINNLVWIHETLANGDFVPRLDTDPQVFAHERLGLPGQPGCVCFFNNDQYNSYTRTVQTSHSPGTRLHEYTGNGGYSNDRWVDSNGCITVTVPKNNNGASYLVYATPDVAGRGILPRLPTTQTFFGAPDLDLPPITNGYTVVGQIQSSKGSKITVDFNPNQAGWGNLIEISVRIVDSSGATLASLPFDDQGEAVQLLTCTAPDAAQYRLAVSASGLPDTGSDYELTVTYTA